MKRGYKMPQYYKSLSISEDGEVKKKYIKTFYEPFKNGVGYNFKYRSAYIKSYLGISLPYADKGAEGFTEIELGRIYRISKLMYSDSNLLAKRVNNIISPIERDTIQEMLKMHRTKFVPFWKKLIALRILKPLQYESHTYFCMNPLYYNSTTYMPKHIFLAFQSDIQAHIPKWVIDKYLDMGKDEATLKRETEERLKETELITEEPKNLLKEKIKEAREIIANKI